MIIRPFTEDDAAAVDALLDPDPDPLFAVQAHPLHGQDRDGERWRRTQVAVMPGDELVGAATVARNRVHPGRYTLVLEVRADHRRRGIGKALVEAARTIRPQPLPLSAKVRPYDDGAMALVRGFGGAAYQHAPSPQLDPTSPDALAWCDAQQAPAGVRFEPLTDVSDAHVAAAWVDQYAWVHESWSPADLTALRQLVGDLTAEVDRAGSFGAWVGDRLAAVCFAFPRPAGGHELVVETVHRDEPGGVALVAATLAAALRRLADRGVRMVELDGHDTDPHLAPVVATLPTGHSDPLLLMQVP